MDDTKQINIILNGDPSKLKAATDVGVKALDQLASSGEKLTETTGKQSAAADALIAKIQRQAAAYSDLQRGLKALEIANNSKTLGDAQADQVYARLIEKYKVASAGSGELGNANKALGMNTSFATREVRALFDELASGRDRQALGTANLLISRMYGLGLGAMAGLVGVAALAGGIVYLGVRAEESERALGAVQANFIATGRIGAMSRDQIKTWVDQLALIPGVSKSAAEGIIVELSRSANIGGDMMQRLTGIIGTFARVTGEDAAKAATTLATDFNKPYEGAKRLDERLNILTASQWVAIERMHKLGDEAGIQAVLFDALNDRMKRVNDNGLTDLEKGTRALGQTWERVKQSFADTGFWDDFSKRLTEKLGLLADFINNFKQKPAPAKLPTMSEQIARFEGGGALPASVGTDNERTVTAIEKEMKAQLALTASYHAHADVIVELQAKKTALNQAYAATEGTTARTAAVTEEYNKSLRGLNQAIDQQAKKGGGLELLQQANKALAVSQLELAGGNEHLLAGEKLLAEVHESTAYKGLKTEEARKEIDDILNKNIAVQKLIRTKQFNLEQDKLDAEAQQRLSDLRKDIADSWDVETENLRKQVDLMGLTNEQRERARLLIKRNQDVLAEGKEVQGIDAINKKYEEQLALLDRRDAKQQELNFWNELADRAVRGIGNMRDAIKEFGRDMAAIFLKKWILYLGASMTGSSSLANAAASAGGNTIAGSAMSSLGGTALGNALGLGTGSIFGGSAAYGAAIGTTSIGAGSQAAMLAAQTREFGATGLAMTAEAGGGVAGSISAGLAAIPVWGWIAIAAIAAYAYFGGKGGGPKSGGSFSGNFAPTGALTSTDATNLFGLQPNESTGNAAVQSIAAAGAKSYYALVRQLGGTSQGFNFGLGYDTDPHGTAQNRIKGILTDAQGNRIYSEIDRQIGRDDKTIGPELQLTTSRMVLAAIKGSQLPVYLEKLFTGVVLETASQTELDALIAKLSATKAAFDGLTSGLTQANDIIAMLNGDSVPALKTQMAGLKKAVDDAQSGFDSALTGGDPIAIQAAQTSLLNAVLNRYQVEKQAIADIQTALSALKQSAYEFNMANAARINRYGGHVDIGAIAMGRITDLQGTINAGGTPAETMANINSFLGVVDSWVSSQETAAQAASAGQAAMAQAQAAATQTRIAALQKELALSQQWAGILNSAQAAIDKMRLTTSNPLGVLGRQSLAGDDVNALLAQYRGASGSARGDLANQVIAAVGTRQGLNESAFQRPSDAYLAAYNANIAILSEVKADAKTEAEKQTDLQSRIEQLTQEANGYAAASANAAQQANGQLDAIYAQARGYAEWAQVQYEKASGEQEKLLHDQLVAITGGLDVGLYQAKMQTDIRDLLDSMNTKITAFLTGAGATVTTPGSGNDTPTPIVGGGGGASPIKIVIDQPVVLDGREIGRATGNWVLNNGRLIKQSVETA